MKCSVCSSENLIKAHYCASCGHPFTEEERKAAYDRTFYGKLDKVRRWKSILTLEVITGSLWFRILSILAILLLGLFLLLTRRPLRLESGDLYKVQYLEETGTYYLITEEDTVAVNLRAPYRTRSVLIREVDASGQTVREETRTAEEAMLLTVSGKTHYELVSSNGTRDTGSLTVYLFTGGEGAKP